MWSCCAAHFRGGFTVVPGTGNYQHSMIWSQSNQPYFYSIFHLIRFLDIVLSFTHKGQHNCHRLNLLRNSSIYVIKINILYKNTVSHLSLYRAKFHQDVLLSNTHVNGSKNICFNLCAENIISGFSLYAHKLLIEYKIKHCMQNMNLKELVLKAVFIYLQYLDTYPPL